MLKCLEDPHIDVESNAARFEFDHSHSANLTTLQPA
jgi:hypothetical protein